VFTATDARVKPGEKVARGTLSVIFPIGVNPVRTRGGKERWRGISIGAIIVWIVVGLIAGILAKWVMPGPDPGGIIVTALIGIVGAFIGGWVLSLLGFSGGTGSFSLTSILTATLGAIILLAIYRLLTRRAA
jgi:uncharacterized membrane protein YeaQ/YmgE (transglycosylase-associated protein family)